MTMALPKVQDKTRERHRGGRRQERRGILGHQGSRGAASHRRGAPRRLDARQCRRLSGTADRPAVQGRPVQPDLPARHAGPLLRDAPQAVRQIAAVGARGRSRVPRHRRARQAGLSGREGLRAVHRRRRDRRRLLHHVDGRGPGVLGSDAAEPDAGRRGARSSPARSRRWPSCTPTIPRRSGSAISASPAIILRARSIAGPSSTAPPRRSTFRNSRSSPNGCRKPCRRRRASRSSTATTASTT